jgi:hypothetical protein
MKVKRFNLVQLRNNEHFQFYTDFKQLVQENNPETLNIAALFAVWLALYVKEDEAFKKILKSALTAEMQAADKQRDVTFRGLAEVRLTAEKHFNQEVRAAATRLKIVFDTYGNLAKLPLNEETAAIYNFLQELKGTYAADIQTIGATDWVKELEANNLAFENITRDRYDESALRSDLVLREVRLEIDAAYRDIIDRLDALCLLEGGEVYPAFIKRLNVVIEKYRNIAAQRQSGK